MKQIKSVMMIAAAFGFGGTALFGLSGLHPANGKPFPKLELPGQNTAETIINKFRYNDL